MFHHRIDRNTPSSAIAHWLLLSFLAGSVNSGGLLACGKFVSHMTGFYTLFGQSAAQSSWDSALGLFSIPLYFIAGVIISALLVEHPARRGKEPHYVLVMMLVSACLALAAVLGSLGWFGEFGDTHLKTGYLLIALLCMASGLQNAAVSAASKHSVRTTHMTGNTTDLGIGIVRTWFLRNVQHKDEFIDEVRAVWLRAGILSSFALGSAVGALMFIRWHYQAFFLPAIIAFYAAAWEAARPYFYARGPMNS